MLLNICASQLSDGFSSLLFYNVLNKCALVNDMIISLISNGIIHERVQHMHAVHTLVSDKQQHRRNAIPSRLM